MRIVAGFCVRKIMDETIAIPTQEAARGLSGLVSMIGTGRFLFELLQTEQTKESLVEALLEQYDVDAVTAEADVDAFVEVVRANGLLEE